MNKTLRTINSNHRIVISLMILGLSVFLMSGCQQANAPANSNATANTNANANSNANTAQTFKNDLVGTWIGVDDPKKKVTFTADEMTLVEDGKENKLKYTRLSNDEIEVVFEGTKRKVKTTFEGDLLTIIGDETVKFKRESASSNANANSQKAEKPPEVKAFENNLAGTWVSDNEKLIFGPDRYLRYTDGKLAYNDAYRALDKENIEYRTGEFRKGKSKITFENGNATLVWTDPYGKGGTFKRESNDSNLSVDGSLRDKLIGNWIGIAGTNSEKENLSIFANSEYSYEGFKNYWYSFPSEGIWSSYSVAVIDDKTMDLNLTGIQNQKNSKPSDIQIKASVDGKVLTVEENGVTKKYNRQTTVD